MKAEVFEAIKRSAAVPSMPAVVVRFLEVIQDPNFEYDHVVRTLSADAGTVSEILRLANSPLFGVRNDVTSLKVALTLLGPKRTRSLVLGRYLVEMMGGRSVDALDMSYCWRRSLVCASAASHFAKVVLPGSREEVFISALLCDIGIPILAQSFPDRYAPIVERFVPYGADLTPEDETSAVDTTHAEVSALVLSYWKLPDVVTASVRLHQAPPVADAREPMRIARLIRAADQISKLLCEIPDERRIEPVCSEALKWAGCGVGVLMDMLPRLEKEVSELANLLRIDVIPSRVYEVIAQTLQEKLQVAVGA